MRQLPISTTGPESLPANTQGEKHGKESRRLRKAASAGRQGESLAADRSRAGSARFEHHGILQAVQRADEENGPGPADSGRITGYADKTFHLHMETAPP